MGSYHNLFGQPSEAQVVVDPAGHHHVTKIIPGSRIADMLAFAKFDKQQCAENFKRQLAAQIAAGRLAQPQADAALQHYEADVSRSTYLE